MPDRAGRIGLLGLVLMVAIADCIAKEPPTSPKPPRDQPAVESSSPEKDIQKVRARLMRQSPPEITLLVEKFHLDGPMLDRVLQRAATYKQTISGINQWYITQRRAPGEQDPKRTRELIEQRLAKIQAEELGLQRDLMGLMPQDKKTDFPAVWLACQAMGRFVNPPEWSAEQKTAVFVKTREHAAVIAAFETFRDQEDYIFLLQGWIRREVLPMAPAKPSSTTRKDRDEASAEKKTDEDKYSRPDSPKIEKSSPASGSTINTANSSCDGEVGGW